MTRFRWAALLFAVFLFVGCGGADEPRAQVDDPRAYAIEALQTMDLNTWWQAYRNPDPTLIGQIVDDIAADLPNDQPGGLPTDQRRLDTLIRNRIAGRYKLYMDDTDEGKAYILAQAEARFADPSMSAWDKNGAYALLDYHILPGEWRPTSRVSEGLTRPPAIEDLPFLKPDVLAASLQRLTDAFPEARIYQIRYWYHAGSDLKRILMQIAPDQRIVYRENGNIAFTADPVPWDDVVSARIRLADLNWDSPSEIDSGPSINYPPDDPLPSRQ
ncbi:MAG: hypothetical protein R2873_11395 [Caldilineaceae bacterium]